MMFQVAPMQGPATPVPRPMVSETAAPAVPVPDSSQWFRPVPIDQDKFSTIGYMTATLAIASAAAIGSNMVDVRNGTQSKTQAVANGLAKGAAASLVLSVTPKQTVTDVALTALALAGTGYAIDRVMKRNKDQICQVQDD